MQVTHEVVMADLGKFRAALSAIDRVVRTQNSEFVQVGAELVGVIKATTPFGLFVDIGGVQGLLHRSEIVSNEVLVVGQRIRVRVKRIAPDPKKPGRRRISLSMVLNGGQ
jgi:small subunit ribosomal protein S1